MAAPNERRSFPADLPEGLKPRLRLFLSVDLVGSTAFKQQQQADWLPVILNFYRDFDHCVHKQYRAFCQRSNSIVAPPEFWKSNGDELLYTCDLVTQDQALDAIRIWLDALNEYRSLMGPEPECLDVKSTAWIGVFPVPNSEVFFRRGGVQFRSDATEDAILLQSEMRDQWYGGRNRQDIVRDFVGPSIDTGFRLCDWASPRRLIISVDLAFLLTSSYCATGDPLPLHFSGRKALKGVIGNAPYPAIWLPVGVGNDLRDENVGRHLADPETIRSYCEAVIEQNYKVITPLFLADDLDDDNFGWAPPFIINQIIHYWQCEKQYRDAA